MATPYKTKSGLLIGSAYQPRQRWEPSADAERLQLALLQKKQPGKVGLIVALIVTFTASVLFLNRLILEGVI